MSKAFRLTAWVVAVLLLAGCGGSSGDKPQRGGSIKIGVVRPNSFDPALATTVSERVMADLLYDGLTKWDPKTLAPVSGLAERWTSSADQKHWTFRLKSNLSAANKEVVTPADVRSSLERIVKNENSPVRELLSGIEGYAAVTRGQATELSGVQVIDNSSVRIDLTGPDAELPRLLGNPNFGIVHMIPNDFISTGPFYLVQDKDKNTVLLKAPGSTAYLDRIDVAFYTDVNAAYAAVDTDKLDWLPVAPDNSKVAGDRFGTGLFRPSLRALYLTFNLHDSRFADQRFREAILHAIDRKSISASISPNSPMLNGIVVDGVPGFNGDSCGTTCTYDVDRARSLIKSVFGTAKPPVITIDISSGPPFTNGAVAQIVSDLSAVGIEAQIRPTQADAFGVVTVQGDRQLFQTSWSAAYPSAAAFIVPMFLGNAPSNVSGLDDLKVNDAVVKAQSESNSTQRQTDWQNAERNLLGTVVAIPVAQFPVNSVLTSNRVRGLIVLPTGNFDSTQVWVN